MAGPTPFSAASDGVHVALQVNPRAGYDRIGPLVEQPDGRFALKVAVSAAPESGKANAAAIRLLARAWKVPKSACRVIRGERDRHKTLFVAGNATDMLPRLEAWLAGRLR